MNKVKNIKLSSVISEYYGKINTFTYDEYYHGNSSVVFAKNLRDSLVGFVDNGKEVIPIQKMNLEEYFYTKHKKDICLGFKYDDNTSVYYHLRRDRNGEYKVVMNTSFLFSFPVKVVKANNNYWLVEKQDKLKEKAVYKVNENKLITDFFDEVEIYGSDNNINDNSISFSKGIYVTTSDGNDKYCGSLSGEMNSIGMFISDPVEESAINTTFKVYSKHHFGINTLCDKYKNELCKLQETYGNSLSSGVVLNKSLNKSFK